MSGANFMGQMGEPEYVCVINFSGLLRVSFLLSFFFFVCARVLELQIIAFPAGYVNLVAVLTKRLFI